MTLPDRRSRVAMTVLVAFAVLATACSPAPGASPSLEWLGRRDGLARGDTRGHAVRHRPADGHRRADREADGQAERRLAVPGDGRGRSTAVRPARGRPIVDDRERGSAHVRIRDRSVEGRRWTPDRRALGRRAAIHVRSERSPDHHGGRARPPGRVPPDVARVGYRRARVPGPGEASPDGPALKQRCSTTRARAWSAGTSGTTGRVASRSPRATRPSRSTFAHAS